MLERTLPLDYLDIMKLLMISFHVPEYKRVLGDFDCKGGIVKTWYDMKVYSMASNLQKVNYSCLLHITLVMMAFMGVIYNKIGMTSYVINEKLYNK